MEHVHERLRGLGSEHKAHIVFAEGGDARIVAAAKQLHAEGRLHVSLVHSAPVLGLKVVDPGNESPLDVANRMVRDGRAQGSVIGAATASGTVITSAIKSVGVKPSPSGSKGLVSSFFIMSRVDRAEPLFFADCAVVLDPTAEQLAAIAIDTAKSARTLLDVSPRIAVRAA